MIILSFVNVATFLQRIQRMNIIFVDSIILYIANLKGTADSVRIKIRKKIPRWSWSSSSD